MPANPDGHEWLRNYHDGELFARIDYVSAQDEEVPLQRVVLFLMAFLVGTAVLGFKNLCRVFAEAKLPEDFVFRVLDIDGAPHPILKTLSRHDVRIGGNGQAYWYGDGEVVAATNVATATDERIRELLVGITQP
jgi:hypothetical protein